MNKPVIGITMGDPVGIGPEIVLLATSDPEIRKICRPLVIGDAGVLKQAAAITRVAMPVVQVDGPEHISSDSDTIDVFNPCEPIEDKIAWGAPTPETSRNMEDYINSAVDMAMEQKIAAMVTCPITKVAMQMAGSRFTGHTELLAERTDAEQYAMMFVGDTLRVVLVTIHIPLREVPDALTRDSILATIRLTADTLISRFNIPEPRICVAALNPHAGEDGLFGAKEANCITPAVAAAKKDGKAQITGPLPADTLFFKAQSGMFDAVVCMYHDQGLIPFKMLHFDDGVNTTIGLPIIRTSVDHGTAYDIAGTGKAWPDSLLAAIRLAVEQAGGSS